MNNHYKIFHLGNQGSDTSSVKHELESSGYDFQITVAEKDTGYLSAFDAVGADAVLCSESLLDTNCQDAIKTIRSKKSGIPVILMVDALTDGVAYALGQYDLDDYVTKSQLKRLPHTLINAIEKSRVEEDRKTTIPKSHRIVEQPNEILVNLSNRILLATREAGIGIWEYQVSANKFVADEVMLQQFGLLPETFTGNYEELLDRVHVDDRDQLIKELTEKVLNYIDFTIEYRIQQIDGSLKYIKAVGVAYDNIPGNPPCMIGTNQDITVDKVSEQKVLLSEQRFRSLVQNSNDLLAILEPTGIYKYVSPTSLKILGYAPDYFIGKSAFDFIHIDDKEKTLASLAGAMTSKHLVAPLFRFQNSSGEWRWIESTITNMLDDAAVQGIVVNSRDVTDRKKANDEIEKLSLVAKNTLSGVYILNKDGQIQWVNQAFTKITEYTLEEALGKKPHELLYRPESGYEAFAPVREKMEQKLNYEGERRNTTKSGRDIFVWLQLQIIFDEAGNVCQYFGVQTDITRQRELEEKVEYEKVQKQKEITSAVYCAQENERSEIGRELHDNVNQLLGAIRLYVNMAKSDDEGRDSLLNDASAFALTAIEEIRKLSRTLITPHIKEVGLVESIRELAEEIMEVHPLRISLVSKDFVDADYNNKFKLNIFRICQEQLNNVLKHANATEAVISIKVLPDNIIVSISDNGKGFKCSDRKKGVGLTNIKSRSELFNGTVKIDSLEGKGTTLVINFQPDIALQKASDLQSL